MPPRTARSGGGAGSTGLEPLHQPEGDGLGGPSAGFRFFGDAHGLRGPGAGSVDPQEKIADFCRQGRVHCHRHQTQLLGRLITRCVA